jgi:hypothetical protein
MKRPLFILLLILLAGRTFTALATDQQRQMVYVWDFTDRTSLQRTELTDNFTHDFEEALSSCDNYQVLERRRVDRLLEHAKNEQSTTQLSPTNASILKLQGAQMVVFGEVFDDKESGQLKVSVTFEDFPGNKKLIKSVLIQRGLINDAVSRMSAMQNLVKKICDQKPDTVDSRDKGGEHAGGNSGSEPKAPAPTVSATPTPGGEWPLLGQALPIEITADLPRSGFPGAVAYEFYLKVDQGDRFHFDVVPVNGAAMRTLIEIYEDGSPRRFVEKSTIGLSQHWTMSKGIPGHRVTVQIISFSLGTLNVRVDKAN